jgi:4-hydroxybenzoate polyprenyltransferase
MMPWLKALRPLQWTKNFLVFAALVFTGQATEVDALLRTAAAFACFCALASAGYLVNDLRDIEADRRHPTKKLRPIAAGQVSKGVAVTSAALLTAAGLVGAWLIGAAFAWTALAYLGLTLLYSLALQKLPVVDVFGIASGFILRAVAGAAAISAPPSPWLLVCTGFVALYLAVSKRRAELLVLAADAADHRANLSAYRPQDLNQFASILAAVSIMSYAMYTFEGSPTPWLMITIPPVVGAFFRYEMLALHGRAGSPERLLLYDGPLRWIVLGWALSIPLILSLVS